MSLFAIACSIGVPVIFATRKPLVNLVQNWLPFDGLTVVDQNEIDVTNQNPHIPLMSLPLLFSTNIDTIPLLDSYFTPPGPPPERLSVENPPGGIKVGIVWASNPDNKAMYERNVSFELIMPFLADLMDLDHSPSFCSLETMQSSCLITIIHAFSIGKTLSRISQKLPVVNQLDLLISVDNYLLI